MAADDARTGDEERTLGGETGTEDEAETEDETETEDDEWNFLHEELIPALVVVGVLLLFFPEPVTSTLGIVLVSVGVLLWAWDIVR